MDIKLRFAALLITLSLILYSCGSDDDKDTVPFSLGISDAAVENALLVVINIKEIRLIPIDENEDDINEGVKVIEKQFTINLLDYQGSEKLTVVSEAEGIFVDTGNYRMELIFDEEKNSFVKLDDGISCEPENENWDDLNSYTGEGCYAIKVPSNRLKVGAFSIEEDDVVEISDPAYILEFDLMQSLVMRGNDPSKNGFIIKPHGLRIVANNESGHITGDIIIDDGSMAECAKANNLVYLYHNHQVQVVDDLIDSALIDVVITEDQEVLDSLPSNYVMPFSSTKAIEDNNGNYTFEFGFVPNGDEDDESIGEYLVALACNADEDNIELWDEILIPTPEKQAEVVKVLAGETVHVTFQFLMPDN